MALTKSEGYNWLFNYNYKTPINLILFCSSKPIPNHLWYLIAMAEIYIFWFLLKKKQGNKKNTSPTIYRNTIHTQTYIIFNL